MPKIPSLSSKGLVRVLEEGGAVFVRQGPTDHAIYSRTVKGRRYSAPIQMTQKEDSGSNILQEGIETIEVH